jgi:ribosomal protein S21
MGLRIEVREGEPLAQAFRRLRRLTHGHDGPLKRPRWHKNQRDYYLKPSTLRRRKALLARNTTLSGEFGRRRWIRSLCRPGKHRRVDFSSCPNTPPADSCTYSGWSFRLSRI